MSFRVDTTIIAKGIGNIPNYYKTDGQLISVIELGGRKYEAFNVYHSDDEISFSTQWADDDTDDMVDELIRMNPGKVFTLNYNCNEGMSETFKCGIFDGEYKRWDKESWNLYEELDRMEEAQEEE